MVFIQLRRREVDERAHVALTLLVAHEHGADGSVGQHMHRHRAAVGRVLGWQVLLVAEKQQLAGWRQPTSATQRPHHCGPDEGQRCGLLVTAQHVDVVTEAGEASRDVLGVPARTAGG